MIDEQKKLRTMDDVLLDGKTVLVRVDFNVSVGDDGIVDKYEDYRLEAAVPTIEELIQRRCRVVLLTHLGRPGEEEGNFDLSPVKKRLEELLQQEVKETKELYGPKTNAIIDGTEHGSVIMLPNVREDEREMNNNAQFAEEIAGIADAYVNEAFSTCHRAHASIAQLPKILPSCAGRRTVSEYRVLTKLSHAPQRPYVAIISGTKVHTKVNLVNKLLNQVDQICVGGKIANTFLSVKEKCPGKTCPSEDMEAAKEIMRGAGEKLILPHDVVVGPKENNINNVSTVDIENIPLETEGIWDLGEKTIDEYLSYCRKAKTVMWNGPVGKFEDERYSMGTKKLAEGLAEVEAKVVVGGGDTAYALEKYRLLKKFDHVSVGGGAMIALLENTKMPGLEPLFQ